MASHFGYNNFTSTGEQRLIEDLIVESIRIYGLDIYYIPRTVLSKDEIFEEGSSTTFNNAISVEMYVRDVNGFTGDGKFLSKFGLEIRDEITFSVALRTFASEVGTATSLLRPQEGDLIFFPLNNKVFSIKFVDHETIFYQLGSIQIYDLVCELFEYSNEVFNTGIPEIDEKYNNYSLDRNAWQITTETSQPLVTSEGNHLTLEEFDEAKFDPVQENDDIQTEANKVLDWSEHDPFSVGAI